MYVAIWIFVSTHSRSENLLFLSLCLSLSLSLVSLCCQLCNHSLAHQAIARKAHCVCGLTEPAAVADVLLARLISLGVVLFRDFTMCMLLYTYLPLAYIIVPRIFCFFLSCRFSKTFGKRQAVRGQSAVLHFPRQHEQST